MSPLNKTPPEPLILRIEKPIYGGAGLARSDGKAIFTHYTLPGELVTAIITNSKSSFAEAAVGEILEASPNRAAPACPYFGACGGCHYQHANYAAQLAMKTQILAETLARAHITDLPAIEVHASEPLGYRNRIRLHLHPATSAACYLERGEHRLIAVETCPIAAPALQQALAALKSVCARQQCGRNFSQVEFSVNHDGSELLLAVWLRDQDGVKQAAAGLEKLCDALRKLLPALTGAICNAAPGIAAHRGGAPAGRHKRQRREEAQHGEREGRELASWGVPRMTYQVAGVDYRVSLGAFFQVNRMLTGKLVELSTGSRQGALAWDLYAGVGLFSCLLASHFEQVVAVEGAPVSCDDLRANLSAPHRAVESSTVEFLRREVARRSPKTALARPDFVLVDPPRAGLGEEAVHLLAQIGPPEITYVSCDPATLSRDLRRLLDSGYKLEGLHLIDLFPQTFHLETVAMLTRR